MVSGSDWLNDRQKQPLAQNRSGSLMAASHLADFICFIAPQVELAPTTLRLTASGPAHAGAMP